MNFERFGIFLKVFFTARMDPGAFWMRLWRRPKSHFFDLFPQKKTYVHFEKNYCLLDRCILISTSFALTCTLIKFLILIILLHLCMLLYISYIIILSKFIFLFDSFFMSSHFFSLHILFIHYFKSLFKCLFQIIQYIKVHCIADVLKQFFRNWVGQKSKAKEMSWNVISK